MNPVDLWDMKTWSQETFVAFDLETTGKYPLESEICEIAAVKWQNGQIVDRFESFVKPSRPMGEKVISIHHITNEMVADAPTYEKVIPEFLRFLGDAVPVAHHAPFDMGFLAVDIERCQLPLPRVNALCTAILSRKAIPASANHRLQTLIKHLGLPQGQAHRALDDSEACLSVALKCFANIGEHADLATLYRFQETVMRWCDFSIEAICEKEAYLNLVSAIRRAQSVEMVYQGGSRPGKARTVVPIGIVRTPNGDFLVAREPDEEQSKRFFLSQISSARIN